MDVPHANAGHRREFKSHLYNRLLRVVFWLFSFADGLQMQPTHAQREISLQFTVVAVVVVWYPTSTQRVNGSVGELDLQSELARGNFVSTISLD